MKFTLKICQTVAGISIVSQFFQSFYLISGGFLPLSPALLSSLRSLNGVNCTQELVLHGVKEGRIAMVAVQCTI